LIVPRRRRVLADRDDHYHSLLVENTMTRDALLPKNYLRRGCESGVDGEVTLPCWIFYE
jgi:hypothetical protein